ncbi:MAG: SMI1/KNR4 family protein [Myxococcota bacterium]
MKDYDRTFPPLLSELLDIEVDMETMEFEPYTQFAPAEENREWIRAWTGNQELNGEEYRFFGQDGTGGLVGFWLTETHECVLEQPVVFFGSEGEFRVLAVDFFDYLWILAGGLGPMEATEYGPASGNPVPSFETFARAHAPDAVKTPAAALEAASKKYPNFDRDFRALLR